MRTITKHIDILEDYALYTFSELSEEAKEKVRDWYIYDSCFREAEIFTEDCIYRLEELFPNSDLKVAYSLNYCQGDGLTIYGNIHLPDLFEHIKEHFTEKEKKFMQHIFKEWCDNYEIKLDHRCPFLSKSDFEPNCDIEWELENYWYRAIRYDVLEKFTKYGFEYLSDLCGEFEECGYKFFYEPTDEEIADDLDANDFEFLEDGTIF